MSQQSNQSEPRPMSADPRPGERVRQRPTERAFVIQFDPIEGVRSRLRGRVEVVGTGEAKRFRSLTQLIGFMVGALRRRAAAEPPA
jgi:hypothetical protein